MRLLFAALMSVTPYIALSSDNTDVSNDSQISVTNIANQKVTISGNADSNHELVLRVEKTERTKQLEWTSTLDGKFDAELSSTDNLSLGEGKFGKGIVFTVHSVGGIGTVNIAMSCRDPVPDGSVRFRPRKSEAQDMPAIKQVDDAITVADIVCDDGTLIPVTVLVRERQITK